MGNGAGPAYPAYKGSSWTAITTKESKRLIQEKLKAAEIKEKCPQFKGTS